MMCLYDVINRLVSFKYQVVHPLDVSNNSFLFRYQLVRIYESRESLILAQLAISLQRIKLIIFTLVLVGTK